MVSAGLELELDCLGLRDVSLMFACRPETVGSSCSLERSLAFFLQGLAVAAGLGAREIGFDVSVELESEFKVGMTGGTVGGVGAMSLAVGVRVLREAAVGTVAMATSVGGFAFSRATFFASTFHFRF